MSEHICGHCGHHNHGQPGKFPYNGHKTAGAGGKGPVTYHPNGKCHARFKGAVTGWFGGESCQQWTPRQEQTAA